MSSGLAIAGVTAVLQRLITDGLNEFQPTSVPTFSVTALPPSRVLTASNGADADQLNLFLYQVTPNSGWRNVALPSRGEDGERRSNPPLALDLHYVLTAYGAQLLNAEILLGCAMQALHELPYLTRDNIRSALTVGTSSGTSLDNMLVALSTSGLAEQIEQIKITPQTLNAEEMSKLWTAFQAPYRATAGYLVTVVLIESRKATRPTLPVRERKVFVMPFRQPTIDAVSPQIVLAGDTLTLEGRHLKGDITKVRFGSVTVDPNTWSGNELEVTVPMTLLAGVNTVQVVHSLDFGTPQEPHRGFASNMAAFMIAPKITPVSSLVVAGDTLTVSVTPLVGRNQRVALLLGDRTIFIPNRPSTGPAVNPTVDFPIPADFPTGTWLVRVQVDGAESALTVDASGKFDGPTVTINAPPP